MGGPNFVASETLAMNTRVHLQLQQFILPALVHSTLSQQSDWVLVTVH